MRRRNFITGIAGAALWPIAARAQAPALPVVAFVNAESADSQYARMAGFFRDGLRETGYVHGQNVTVEYHWAEGQNARLPAIIEDLVRRRVTVIAATTTPAALAAKKLVSTIPVVFETGGDPIDLGLVNSLNQPAANMTGVTQTNREVAPKRLELLHEVLPQAKDVSWLVNPDNPRLIALSSLLAAAKSLGVQLHRFDIGNVSDLDRAFESAVKMHTSALIVGDDPFLTSHSERIGALAARYGIPAIYKGREFVIAGGLMSYGTSVGETYRLAGVYTGRILKGSKPGDLPIERASKVELFINLKSANALGLTIPLPISGRADEVIE